MTEKLIVLGCGYTGCRVAREAAERGMEVVGTSRDDETLHKLRDIGVTPIKWDVLKDDVRGIEQHLGPETALVYSIPTIYREYDDEREGVPRHVVPVKKVMLAAEEQGLDRFIYLSSTSVYGDHGGDWVDETTSTDPASPYGRMREDIENYVLSASVGFPANVARLVGIYGPDRTILDYMKSGRYKLVDGGTKPTNRIHVDDIVESVLAMVTRGSSQSRVYNVCDGHPLRVVDLVDFLVKHLGVERPTVVSLEEYAEQRGPNVAARWKSMYRCKNERLTEELGVELKHPTALDGYRAIFGIDQPAQ
jgi:nucleoside-diphosphate-sugar epimerase